MKTLTIKEVADHCKARTDAWSLNKLKAETAKDLQKAIRLEAADKDGMTECVTCGKKQHWKECHAGHFISSRCNSILFEEDVLAVQCIRCNVYLSGNQEKYTAYMVARYGAKRVEELRRQRSEVVKFTREQLLEMRARGS